MADHEGGEAFFSKDVELDFDLPEDIEELDDRDVPDGLVARIDAALITHARASFQKVARIVSLAMKSIPDAVDTGCT